MEWVESTGSSIDEAKERALDRLGVHADDAEFEIVSDVKVGLFGRVKEEARVRARVAPATPRAKEERGRGRGRANKQGNGRGGRGENGGTAAGSDRDTGDRSDTRAEQGRGSERKRGEDADRQKKQRPDNRSATARREKREHTMSDDTGDQGEMMPLPQQADLAEEFVRGLAERFGTTVGFTREDIDEEEIRITVTGDDLGRMVGRRGTTAGAIDELVRTVLQRQAGSSRNGRIRVDVGGVRARRAEALANFSRAQAQEVRSSGTRRVLEPMSAADRKVVHDALTDEEGVETTSEGEDSQRRVVIMPTRNGD